MDSERFRFAHRALGGHDAYEVLGVRPDADAATIRAAYLRLMRTLHPDSGGDVERARLVNLAWQVLTEDRAGYDRLRASGDLDELAAADEREPFRAWPGELDEVDRFDGFDDFDEEADDGPPDDEPDPWVVAPAPEGDDDVRARAYARRWAPRAEGERLLPALPRILLAVLAVVAVLALGTAANQDRADPASLPATGPASGPASGPVTGSASGPVTGSAPAGSSVASAWTSGPSVPSSVASSVASSGVAVAPAPPRIHGAVSARAHSCAVRVGRALWCTGNNEHGQLGNGSTRSAVRPVPVVGGARWTVVTAGLEHTCGLRTDRTLWCWGGNRSGELGLGSVTTTPVTGPRQVGGRWWSAITARGRSTCGIRSDHTVWCWGVSGAGAPVPAPHRLAPGNLFVAVRIEPDGGVCAFLAGGRPSPVCRPSVRG